MISDTTLLINTLRYILYANEHIEDSLGFYMDYGVTHMKVG